MTDIGWSLEEGKEVVDGACEASSLEDRTNHGILHRAGLPRRRGGGRCWVSKHSETVKEKMC